VFALIYLDQGCKNIQLVAFCRTLGGIPQLLHPSQCPLVIGFPSNGLDVHISPSLRQSCRNPHEYQVLTKTCTQGDKPKEH
jgi:hypothetical protein